MLRRERLGPEFHSFTLPECGAARQRGKMADVGRARRSFVIMGKGGGSDGPGLQLLSVLRPLGPSGAGGCGCDRRHTTGDGVKRQVVVKLKYCSSKETPPKRVVSRMKQKGESEKSRNRTGEAQRAWSCKECCGRLPLWMLQGRGTFRRWPSRSEMGRRC